MEHYHTLVRKRRKFLKISQNDLAYITGISRRSLQEIESGKSNPGINQLVKVFEALGLEMRIEVKSKF